jgi:hypothetical protein
MKRREERHIHHDYYGTRNGRTVAKFLISRVRNTLLFMSDEEKEAVFDGSK